MVFNSISFFIFFAVVLIPHHMPFPWNVKKFNLLIASYIFYGAWNPPFLFLLWFVNLLDWFVGSALGRLQNERLRFGLLMFSLIANLGLLALFKYSSFLLDSASVLLAWFGIAWSPPHLEVVLPIGISFYTFHTMAYTIDVYRRAVQPWKSFLDFGVYVAFFPQLVAGPILRVKHFLPQCLTPRRATPREFSWGLMLLSLGVFGKVILADWAFGPVADEVFSFSGRASTLDAWTGVLAFSGQIYFDFAGYSLCAIGTALCLGFVVPQNFNFPYAAVGFSDFWKRWHISLSSWLRDYLYIPLGGNRKGTKRTYVNLMLTMLLGGLWHGASWRFVIWGGLHGSYLAVEKFIQERFGASAGPARTLWMIPGALLTYLLVLVTWVFFRAQDMAATGHILGAMFLGSEHSNLCSGSHIQRVMALSAGLLVFSWFMRESSLANLAGRLRWWMISILLAALLLTLFLNSSGDSRGFIYFQF